MLRTRGGEEEGVENKGGEEGWRTRGGEEEEEEEEGVENKGRGGGGCFFFGEGERGWRSRGGREGKRTRGEQARTRENKWKKEKTETWRK